MPDSTLHVRKTLGGNNVFTMTSNSLNANAIQFRNDDNTLQGSFLATGTPFGYGTYLSNQVNLTGGSGGIGLRVSNTSNINFYGGNVDPDFGVNYFRLFGSTGNVLIQNGGTFTDAGFRLDVNGTARVQGVLTTTADAVVNGVNVGRGGGSISNNTRVSNNGLNANTTGNNNIAIGVSALALNTEGNANVAIGTQALSLNLIGASNTAIGFFAAVNTTSNDVTAIGSNALRNNTTGTQNVALGKSALTANITGSGNTALGTSALPSNTTGGNNVAIGLFALNGASTSSDNIAIGRDTIRFLTSGNNNLAIGTNSGRRIADGTNLTIANNSLFIGFDTRPAADNQTNQIVIGHTAIGLGSNTTVLGNTSTTHGRWYGSLLLGTTTNAASSILTMESTTQGFLPPRMTSAQRTAIASPAEGLLVIQTDGVQGLYIYINATWRAVAMI
jgi:hypothetical protein